MDLNNVLSIIPDSHRKPLLKEYNLIVQHFIERRWTSTELSGGKFSEIIYNILNGYATSVYTANPTKPSNMVDACKRLENYTNVPRSFQILIPRMLPALYEIRNNRNVGHIGGDVDSNLMDSIAVATLSSWIMGELIRVFHNLSTQESQKIVDLITSRKIPLVWTEDNMKRVLIPNMGKKHQILLLISTETTKTNTDLLFKWLDMPSKTYYGKILKQLHKERKIELSRDLKEVQILPPGIDEIEKIILPKYTIPI